MREMPEWALQPLLEPGSPGAQFSESPSGYFPISMLCSKPFESLKAGLPSLRGGLPWTQNANNVIDAKRIDRAGIKNSSLDRTGGRKALSIAVPVSMVMLRKSLRWRADWQLILPSQDGRPLPAEADTARSARGPARLAKAEQTCAIAGEVQQ